MPTINNFEDLTVWKDARKFSQMIGELCKNNGYLRYDHLRIQMERASGSIMDNIAEGFERGSNKEFVQFLYYAKGSSGEVRSQLYRSFDYYLIDDKTLEKYTMACKKIGIQIFSFINYLKKSTFKGDKFNHLSEPEAQYSINAPE